MIRYLNDETGKANFFSFLIFEEQIIRKSTSARINGSGHAPPP
jgi:hypothetical protein